MAEFKPDFAWLRQRPLCFLAFGFGSGLAPKAPGTFGTLPALPMAYVLNMLGITGWWLALLCGVLFVWGIRICNHAENELGIQDYGGIVWDEIVAMLLVLAFVPFAWQWWLAAFVVFRLFDALKPWPIKWFDARVHGGFGIMLDDLIAALMSLLVLNFVHWAV
ncbi:phosphatidylglycerophosphatase A family protein [Neisseria animalis]|uniref:Phosphatidylglycerophosphatase A n=1 Tax=Neisseria animalis TaxID=492 RepID=A0A5P3MTZ2_NEIAN|nr:phosphatidylglycerophosphatase A [Neisseria animalis]QEY25034.1 phosphatidylglycerophosphatase A [Neisseria animalis]ROW31759.1 phosphatidylglycerophosphatase A [Neisseria animalis]VEE06866.1 phosphatidylglycerophosphatase A [Neisseria animalis]